MKQKINWKDVQDFYDQNNSYREIRKKFGYSHATIARAVKRGDFIPRTRSDSVKLSRKLKPQIMTQETKDKISVGRKRFLEENPDKVPYLLNHPSKGPSYPEKYFTECLLGSDFKAKFRVSTYELDFANVEKKINLEIDGCQHRLDPRIVIHDIKRNKYLISLGWKIIRVNWSEFKKLNSLEKENLILSIKSDDVKPSLVVSLFGEPDGS